jgi:hypothetical protein
MYQIIALIVFVAAAVVIGAVWWYSTHTASIAQQLQSQQERQSMIYLYDCLNAVYKQGQIVFPSDVVWVKNPQMPDCANAMNKMAGQMMGGPPQYWDGGQCGMGASQAVSASPGDVVALPGVCYIQVLPNGSLLVTAYGS